MTEIPDPKLPAGAVAVEADPGPADPPRTEILSYENRVLALQPRAHAGEAALVVDPIESPLWYVNHSKRLEASEVAGLLELAESVNEWVDSRIASSDDDDARAS